MHTVDTTEKALAAKAAWVTERLHAHFGRPRQPARAKRPLDVLIGTVLSQNTSDVNSDRAYRSLRARFPKWEDALAASPRAIAASIRCGGLARQKSRRIKSLLRWVRSSFGVLSLSGLHRLTDEEVRRLLAPLPGIGPKTLNVLMAFALHRDVFPVDTHVHRVTRRVGLIPPKANAEKAHRLLAPLVPKGEAYSLHVNLIRLGRERCHPRKADCPQCPLLKKCETGSRKRLAAACQ